MKRISTPPWKVETYLEPYNSKIKTYQVVSSDGLIVAKCGTGDFEVTGNAELIASAPEMQATIKELAEALEYEMQMFGHMVLQECRCTYCCKVNTHTNICRLGRMEKALEKAKRYRAKQ